ncbi:MAG: hypothetical protein MNPFHGCM_02650 [Gemmatimonadaceae bacterium]|nr:hypothetical protein [Gemmatimonadaceae bacterium]
MRSQIVALSFAVSVVTSPAGLVAQGTSNGDEPDSAMMAGLRWRNIGPFNFQGRISDVAGIPSPSKTFFVAAAAGGIWKTTNNGQTWRPVFDNQRVISMGMLAIAPSDTMQVWAGTGEANSRNSISPGGGVFKSTDGGLTWRSMGLERTQAIGRIVVHPTNPNIVYVAAVGAIWNANKERGLYRTMDGGENWELVKFVSDKAGVVDVALDPSNPDIVWCSSWERVRGPYFLQSGGPGSALWKSTDGGTTWAEVKGNGFPETTKGRISIAISPSEPKVMYTMVEADSLPDAPLKRARGAPPPPPMPAKSRLSGLYRSEDGGLTWTRTNSSNERPFYYSQVRVHPKNPDRVYWSSTPVKVSNDGGKTAMNATTGVHVDHHAMWIDPVDPDRMIVGNDGGVAVSFDQGGNYDNDMALPIGQFYNVSFDMAVPYTVCAGAQDNGSWCGPSRRKSGGITNAMWRSVGSGDGFVTMQDPTDPNIVYSESQGGAIARFNLATGERSALGKPQWRPIYRRWEDSILVERGDTTQPETSQLRKRIAGLRSRQAADSAMLSLRWNWNTPFFISPHNASTLYFGANRVLKSTQRGDEMFLISPDLTARDTTKIRISMRTTGGITPDATGAETYATIVSLNESPIRPGILFAGTDDGKVWTSKNDGGSWEELTGRFPGVPSGAYVSRIEPSPHDSLTFFVSFDNHRTGDFTPYLYATSDFGKAFRSIASNLPVGGPDFVHVVRQDPVNRNLLFLGTDVGAYVSVNLGRSWTRLGTGLPTVPVHDLRIHPREHELIAATHGRSLWILDIAPLQQSSPAVASSDVWLYTPRVAQQWGEPPVEGQSTGQKFAQVPSPAYGADIWYRLATRVPGQVSIVITGVQGDTLRSLSGPGTPGLHKVTWDFRGRAPTPAPLSISGRRDSVLIAQRLAFVFDSLSRAGMDSTLLGRIRRLMESGDPSELFAMFAGGAGPTARFIPRPAETGGRGAGSEGGQPDLGMLSQLQDVMKVPGHPNINLNPFEGGGAVSRAPTPIVGPGEYLVTISANGKILKRTLRVERASGSGIVSSVFER